MKVTAYHLKPRGPMHFGERGVGVETASVVFHADSLFSALCHAVLEDHRLPIERKAEA